MEKEESLTLKILETVEADSDVTQRRLADRLGVALGLANSYLRRCVRKGLLKVHQAPANRYLYYVTPRGFAEKSRLTARYLSASLEFYRRAGDVYAAEFESCRSKGWTRVVLCGASELAEIAAPKAAAAGVDLVGILDSGYDGDHFAGLPVLAEPGDADDVDAWLLSDITEPQARYDALAAELDPERVLAPALLGVRSARGSA